jgi:CPA2 family monovalent cation:H+ antiporter-2
MPHATPLLATLAAGFVVAFVLGALAHRLKLSPLVGYLLAGMLVGPATPGFVADPAMAAQLADFGVVLLMFGVGLHFSLDDLLAVRRVALPWALLPMAVATCGGFAIGAWMGWAAAPSIVFGLALAVASTVVLLRALEDHQLLDTQRGKTAVGWLVVEDLVMVLVLVLLPALAPGAGDGVGAAAILAALAITLLKLGGFVGLMLVVGRRAVPWLLRHVAGTGSRELFTLSILAIALGVAFGSAQLFGVSFALGAFFAGLLLNESELSSKAAADTLPLRDAFAVLFFVSVGMLFDPHVLLAHPLQVLAAVVVIVGLKPFAAWGVVRLLGQRQSLALTIAASVAQIGEFSFILAGLAAGLGLLPAPGRDLILAAALLSILANPLLFVALAQWRARQTRAINAAQLQVADPLPGPPLPEGDHTIVVGYGRVGAELAALLRARGVPLVVVESDAERVANARNDGLAAVRSNAASPDLLAVLAPQRSSHALVAIPNAFEAGQIIARLRAAHPAMTILARAHGDAESRHLLDSGADGTVLAERELAHAMAEMVLNDPRLGST